MTAAISGWGPKAPASIMPLGRALSHPFSRGLRPAPLDYKVLPVRLQR
jgi:hypothetical protein